MTPVLLAPRVDGFEPRNTQLDGNVRFRKANPFTRRTVLIAPAR
jgi:hypothetical protein